MVCFAFLCPLSIFLEANSHSHWSLAKDKPHDLSCSFHRLVFLKVFPQFSQALMSTPRLASSLYFLGGNVKLRVE